MLRRHPFLTALFILASLPVLALLALEVAQERSECRRWRYAVESAVLRESGVERPPPASGMVEGVPFAELREGHRDQVAHEMRASRPPFCSL